MGPLSRYRILDLTHVWAGPFSTRLLADMGAQVIKVESTRRPDLVRGTTEVASDSITARGYPFGDPGEYPWNRTSRFNERNRSKLGITLDLTTPQGVKLLKALVRICDVVAESFSARVIGETLGLGYQVLQREKPDLVMVSMPGFGSSGPWRDFTSFGTTIEHLAGVVSLTGYSPEEYMKSGVNLPDGLAALHVAAAVLLALFHRDRTGEGQWIDVSQQESTICLLGEHLLGYAMTGELPRPRGNRSSHEAPQGAYSCRDPDSWVTVSVGNQKEWEGLCQALGKEELVTDPRFDTTEKRRQNHDELDAIIGEWTYDLDKYQAAHRLQRYGVPAGPVLNVRDQFGDPHVRAREMLVLTDHPSVGPREYPGIPWKLKRAPGRVQRPAPTLGQHNNQVLGDLLGLSARELEDLEHQGIIGTMPVA